MARKRKAGEQVMVMVRIGRVPFDMMRHDRACPSTSEDANKLERIANGNDTPDDHLVTFACFAHSAPTVDRWKSFGCEILAIGEEKVGT